VNTTQALQPSIARDLLGTNMQRNVVASGVIAGLGLGCALAWAINIFEIGNPRSGLTIYSNTPADAPLHSLYPSMALTVFVVLLACCVFGLGLGLMAAALLRGSYNSTYVDHAENSAS
jgi:hypothetical protein